MTHSPETLFDSTETEPRPSVVSSLVTLHRVGKLDTSLLTIYPSRAPLIPGFAPQEPLSAPDLESLRNREIFEALYPSVVKVVFRPRNSHGNANKAADIGWQAVGSGFVIRQDGVIGTNAHVAGAFDSNKFEYGVVMFSMDANGTTSKKTLPAEILAIDPLRDIATLKVDAKGLKPVRLGNSNKHRVGDKIVTVGSSLGVFDNSFSQGVISSLPQAYDPELSDEANYLNTYMTSDADIQSGNSGGVAADMNKRIVGITTATIGYQGDTKKAGIIPINEVKTFLLNPELFANMERTFPPLIVKSLADTAAYENSFRTGIATFKQIFEKCYAALTDAEKKARAQALFNDPAIIGYFLMLIYGQVINKRTDIMLKSLRLLEAEFGVTIGITQKLEAELKEQAKGGQQQPAHDHVRDVLDRTHATLQKRELLGPDEEKL